MNENYFDGVTEFIFVDRKPEKSDIIFVPGNGYPQMAKFAAKLWRQGYSKYILPSGKYSISKGKFGGVKEQKEEYQDDYTTEWEFLRDVLMKNGVEESAILREDRAVYTYQNALFSKQITDQMGLDIKKAIICCRNFHARRCLMYYQMVYPDTRFFVCPSDTQGITKENWYTTEKGRKCVFGEVERCGKQFVNMF